MMRLSLHSWSARLEALKSYRLNIVHLTDDNSSKHSSTSSDVYGQIMDCDDISLDSVPGTGADGKLSDHHTQKSLI